MSYVKSSPKADSTKADNTKADSTKADSTKADSTKADSTKADSTKADSKPRDLLQILPTRGHLHPLAHAPFLHLQSQQYSISNLFLASSGTIISTTPSFVYF